MKPCWRQAGLTEKGAELADKILSTMQQLVREAGSPMAEAALREATFRVEVLPKRSAEFQKRYAIDNGEGKG
jgi:hypothetical protein